MADAPFIYVDSSPEPEVQPIPPPRTTAKGKGKAKARPPPTDEEVIMISDDDGNDDIYPKIRAEYGVPGPSGNSAFQRATHSQTQQSQPTPHARLEEISLSQRDPVAAARDESPIPQWVLDDVTTTVSGAVPSGSVNQNEASVELNEPIQSLPLTLELQEEGAISVNQNGFQSGDRTQADLQIPPRPIDPTTLKHIHQGPGPSRSALSENERDDVKPKEDIVSAHLASVLAVIPDVQPEFALVLINEQLASAETANNAVELVINQLFDSSYPKIEKKRKRDAEGSAEGPGATGGKGKGVAKDEKKGRIDWSSLERPIPAGAYVLLALDQLGQDFRYVAKAHVKNVFSNNNHLYYPSFFQLRRLDNTSPFWKKVPTPRPKGKAHLKSEDFDLERKAVLDALAAREETGFVSGDEGPGASNSKQADQIEEDEEVEGGIECGCCFSAYAFENMIQCPDAHLFCKTCARRTAEEAIGGRKAVIKCMDQDGCQLEFPVSEIKRFLDSKAYDLLEKIKAERAVTDACLEGLEECPFCDFKCIIENDQERLFRCENEDCGIVSCRQCKKEDHLPKSCAEVVEDRDLDARHAVEEAMTEALMRKCPKCSKAFIKENGCNKMRCPYCQTLSCYVCRQTITGYDHFNEQPGHAAGSKKKDKKKCPLWDDLDKRHHDEVAEAARQAARAQELANPDVNPDQLKVDLPQNPPRPAENAAPLRAPPIPIGFGVGAFGFDPPVYRPPPAGGNPFNAPQNDFALIEAEARQQLENGLAQQEELLARVRQQNAELQRVQQDIARQQDEILAMHRAREVDRPHFGFGGGDGNPIFRQGQQHALRLFGAPLIPNPPERQRNPFIAQEGLFHQAAPVADPQLYNAGPRPAQHR